jgi:GntR family transcriptional regulator of arabinose operon
MEIFGISRQTVRHAVGVLEYENILERRQGVGTFVSAPSASNGRKNIGVMLGFLGYINSEILHGIEHILQKEDYSIQLALSEYEIEIEYKALRSFIENGVQGIILDPARSRLFNPRSYIFNEIEERGIPLIFMGGYREDSSFPYVSMDDAAAGRTATEYLIAAGHTKIAGFFVSDVMAGVLRFRGYMEALFAASMPYTPWQTLWYTNEDELEVFKCGERVMKRLEGCTAVVCYNDRLAVHLIDALTTAGIRVPEDISVIGIDNTDLASLCKVPLTTISHPKANLGRRIAKNMLKRIKTPDFDPTCLIKPRLIERESVLRKGE